MQSFSSHIYIQNKPPYKNKTKYTGYICTQTPTTNFWRGSPLNIALLKKYIRVGHAGIVVPSLTVCMVSVGVKQHWRRYCRPFNLYYWYEIIKKENTRKEWTKTIKTKQTEQNYNFKCIMANTSAIWQQAAHTTYQLSPPSCSIRATQKSPRQRIFSKKVRTADR